MELWTKELEEKSKAFPIGSQDGKGENAEVLVKYFNPYGAGTWIITEAEKQEDGDWLLFGYCHIIVWEWGYVSLKELQDIRIKIGSTELPLERDLHVKDGTTVKELLNK